MNDISNDTLDKYDGLIDELGSSRNIFWQLSRKSAEFRLGRALGRLEGYRDSYYSAPEALLHRRFLSRKVHPCMRTLQDELVELDEQEGREIAGLLRQWFELAMEDMGIDYSTLE